MGLRNLDLVQGTSLRRSDFPLVRWPRDFRCKENTTIVISISHLSLQIQMRLKCARATLSQPTTPCFSHYNFQRFCRVVQAHYMYLRKLPEFEIQCFSCYKVKNGKGEKWVLWRLMCFTLRLSEWAIFQQRIDLWFSNRGLICSNLLIVGLCQHPKLKEGRQLRERADPMTKIVGIIVSAVDAKFVLQNKLLINMWIWHEVGHIICEDVWKRLHKCCNFCFECWLFAAFQMSNLCEVQHLQIP